MTSKGWVAALLSGALLAVSRDTGRFGWLVLAAPVPLPVHALRATRARHVAGPAFVAGSMAEAGPCGSMAGSCRWCMAWRPIRH
jgi:apolipoprotein N-acyltransferase